MFNKIAVLASLGVISLLSVTGCHSLNQDNPTIDNSKSVEMTTGSVQFSRMPTTSCSNLPPKGELVATRIKSANTTRSSRGLYEGPVWINNALYFSDFLFSKGFPSRIQKLNSDGSVSTFMDNAGSNGLAADTNGNIIAATHKFKGLSSYGLQSGKRNSVIQQFQNNVFNSPNDIAITKDGTIYFTDPDYQRDAAPGGQPKTRVYRISPLNEISVVEEGLYNPNGITLSPDEKYLYVVGTTTSGVLRKYEIVDGVPQFGKDIVSNLTIPDGMAVDCAGNIYVTEHPKRHVRVFTPEGKQISMIKVDADVTNVAFGGAESKTLYITGRGAVWKIDLTISGSAY